MFIEKYDSANNLMKREALMGHYGIRCFNYFEAGEDAVVVYPNWAYIEMFCAKNKEHSDRFEVLSGTEFDLCIENAVLVCFEGDDRKVIASKKAVIKRAKERNMVIDMRN